MENFYQILEHVTDLKIKVSGKTLMDLFKNAGLALFYSLDSRSQIPEMSGSVRTVAIKSADRESLLVDWLSELLALHDIHNENYFEINITELTDTSLSAEIRGTTSTQDRFDVKGATYHDLKIEKTNEGFEAIVLFDI
ncbi:archease [Patescibacteria group bacterium]|nr:archease [Patescibacteria group bacterium]